MESLDQATFESACREQVIVWQRLLRLQDWKIEVEFWPHKALGNSVAKTESNLNNKSALIVLRYPDDLPAVEHEWPAGEAGDYDLSIVHELLHLMMRPMDCELLWAEEQACNLLASALVSLYRAQPQGPPTLSPCGRDEAHKAPSHGHYL